MNHQWSCYRPSILCYHPVYNLSTLYYHADMYLKDYIKEQRLSMRRFASKAGLSVSAVSLIVRNKRFPQPETMRRIFLATDGKVKADDFFKQYHGQ
jgi:predicted transcriptional regulator